MKCKKQLKVQEESASEMEPLLQDAIAALKSRHAIKDKKILVLKKHINAITGDENKLRSLLKSQSSLVSIKDEELVNLK